ncbi:hypothetical protein P278_21140 [Zhouia amylolytica AD3]|uniref:Uncharacterized protein n=1 Tax=Zhouia amylolytica AD3 TaxID=1286632 RepID=W2UNA3_9FLAO|nr:hypothetical protein P278_21140 [Zhouia amylolytica AD3]
MCLERLLWLFVECFDGSISKVVCGLKNGLRSLEKNNSIELVF